MSRVIILITVLSLVANPCFAALAADHSSSLAKEVEQMILGGAPQRPSELLRSLRSRLDPAAYLFLQAKATQLESDPLAKVSARENIIKVAEPSGGVTYITLSGAGFVTVNQTRIDLSTAFELQALWKQIELAIFHSQSGVDWLVPQAHAGAYGAVMGAFLTAIVVLLVHGEWTGRQGRKALESCRDLLSSSLYRDGPKSAEERSNLIDQIRKIEKFERMIAPLPVRYGRESGPQFMACVQTAKRHLGHFFSIQNAPDSESGDSGAR